MQFGLLLLKIILIQNKEDIVIKKNEIEIRMKIALEGGIIRII